ncbi:hypothetical protein EA004_06005 [Vibrio anguillarum]|uniref:Uncharacterized protein n=1 Tax=Vibrio anguillarum TaxID=55601 RepID=A0ABR9Z7G7_VIBAN|nr:hypothetical protein DD616_04855 [Vibrio anguillarum]MBF4244599.1 hypothetical protein [Vibrio anguillarum]MBF4374333.1 hypothetical protein [Vibrio anguillarum]NNN70565.1 hypothetical protein [Vibrio sp. 3-2(1)]
MVETLTRALIIFYSKAPKKRDQSNIFFPFGKALSMHITLRQSMPTMHSNDLGYSVVAIYTLS